MLICLFVDDPCNDRARYCLGPHRLKDAQNYKKFPPKLFVFSSNFVNSQKNLIPKNFLFLFFEEKMLKELKIRIEDGPKKPSIHSLMVIFSKG